MPLSVGVSIGAALLLHSRLSRWRGFFRTALFAPVVTTLVAVAVIWRYLLNTRYGLLNYALGGLGVDPIDWLGDPRWAMPSIILFAVWKNFGYNMIIFLAGLQSIPEELYEAARIDGASVWRQFRHVTLPMLAPILAMVSILTTAGYFQLFAEPYVMTQGGPLQSTVSVLYFMYEEGFKWWSLGLRLGGGLRAVHPHVRRDGAAARPDAGASTRARDAGLRRGGDQRAPPRGRRRQRLPAPVDALGVVDVAGRGQHVPAAARARPGDARQLPRAVRPRDIGRYLVNSVFLTTAVTALSLVFNVAAGYAFAKLEFAGRDRIFRTLLGALVIPSQVAMVPLFLLLKQLGLVNTYGGVIVPAMASIFGIFLVRQYALSIPGRAPRGGADRRGERAAHLPLGGRARAQAHHRDPRRLHPARHVERLHVAA